ncbi:unnamed protein product [Didymodactylos carnosus]|uniref:Beta-galactosidase n=1 Tax=Didymodactylos carnosus TaxID=1234261 RepID=A0A814FWC5_9BILA|nr:unnamed protein product [Didymodactylos carnosus]CAF0988391.1 unnamed protein product [Didymodactylos carnosus]CAF3752597.1 unnamed protein product [Didymodactylos carnosus]CAF3760552.1 unnamed protein product [Didymodactylos carnosus]
MAADNGLFINLRIGPYVCAEWNNGGLPAWLNNVKDISFRSYNEPWLVEMKRFIGDILNYVKPYLASNGGPIILAQIENEYGANDQNYVDWCGKVAEEFNVGIPWIMCNGHSANNTIETCNSCNCVDDGWTDNHLKQFPQQPFMFTENEGWFQQWGEAVAIRATEDLAYSAAEWFAAGGAYHSYYMWHGGNNYGRSAGSGITTMYTDDTPLHSDGTPNEPKYSHLARLQLLIAQHAPTLLSQDIPARTALPYWDGSKWSVGTQQFAYIYGEGEAQIVFVINQAIIPLQVLYRDTFNITMTPLSVQIIDQNVKLLWDSSDVSGVHGGNSIIIPVVQGPLQWQVWQEPIGQKIPFVPVIIKPVPYEQLNMTNDDTVYLWYRRNITLIEPNRYVVVGVQTRKANAMLFFIDGHYLGEFDDHQHSQGNINARVSLDMSSFQPGEHFLEILSISLGLDNGVWANNFEYKGIVGDVTISGVSIKNSGQGWEHQKGLVGEYLQIYTAEGTSKVQWNAQWTKGINKPVTWFQTKFDLSIPIQDLNGSPLLLDANGLTRGHAYINGNDLGLYWLITGECSDDPPCCCQQAQKNCMTPTQRLYHIPPDWLQAKDNLLTIFEDSGAQSPGSVSIVRRIITS